MFRIAITADLHWGVKPAGNAATLQLRDSLQVDPPDLLVIAGDIGTQEHFPECLALFRDLPCIKALVPGNHDIWVEADDPRGDSLSLYENRLPELCRQHGFHFLDQSPLLFPEQNLAVAGTMNWYDYSWSEAQLRAATDDWEFRLRSKLFSRGRHNDFNFVRWPLDDRQFTERIVARFRLHLQQALIVARSVIVVTHHPALYGLNYPAMSDPPSIDRLLWEAFSGNAGLEQLVLDQQGRIPLVLSGHTHRAREYVFGSMKGYNIGGDYHFKRLLRVEWPGGEVAALEFHA